MDFHLKLATSLTRLLDSQFQIGNRSFGLDPILGLIPGFGDLFSLALSFYTVWIAINLKLPTFRVAQMISNIIMDFLVGLIPLVGDLADFAIKANTKNMEILRRHSPTNFVDAKVI